MTLGKKEVEAVSSDPCDNRSENVNAFTGSDQTHHQVFTNSSFHVTISVHGAFFSESRIDALSCLNYVIRLGSGEQKPHEPVVISRFLDGFLDGVSSIADAVGFAVFEISSVLQKDQRIFSVNTMSEDRWDECEGCRETASGAPRGATEPTGGQTPTGGEWVNERDLDDVSVGGC